MQLVAVLSVAAAIFATPSVGEDDASKYRNAAELNQNCNKEEAHARIVNRCDYPVNVWSVWQNVGCDYSEMMTLEKGESYFENYANTNESAGVSIKISKTDQCKGNGITQLEYYLEFNKPGFNFNYLDVSYVDCLDGDCPTKQEGFYLQAGTKAARIAKASSDNSWCPILACSDAASCAKMAYILPNDVQTKTCDHSQTMTFYMCGSDAPSDDDSTPASSAPASSAPASSAPAQASSSKKAASHAPKASSTVNAPSSADYYVDAAAVTIAPEVKEIAQPQRVQTKVVYVTAYEYVNAKRHEHDHAHAHARRHVPFNA